MKHDYYTCDAVSNHADKNKYHNYLFLTVKIFLYKQDHDDSSRWVSSQLGGNLSVYPKILNRKNLSKTRTTGSKPIYNH